MSAGITEMEWQEWGRVETLRPCWWNLKLIEPFWKTVVQCLLKLNISRELYTYITKGCIPEYS